uniref:Uncharacterized protein n=1 Tax=Aegilops tauschii subsp. strangulata TaxID=200361 RepID=A0A452XMI8_AEGTS
MRRMTISNRGPSLKTECYIQNGSVHVHRLPHTQSVLSLFHSSFLFLHPRSCLYSSLDVRCRDYVYSMAPLLLLDAPCSVLVHKPQTEADPCTEFIWLFS